MVCQPRKAATTQQDVGPHMKRSALIGFVMRAANALVAQPAAMGGLGTWYAATADDVEGGECIGPTEINTCGVRR